MCYRKSVQGLTHQYHRNIIKVNVHCGTCRLLKTLCICKAHSKVFQQVKFRGIQYTIFSFIPLWKNPLECDEWNPKSVKEILSNIPSIQLYKLTFEFCRKTITLLKSIIFFFHKDHVPKSLKLFLPSPPAKKKPSPAKLVTLHMSIF